MKKLLWFVFFGVCTSVIAATFWQQQLQYSLPTPVPEKLNAVEQFDTVSLDFLNNSTSTKPYLFHFYNPNCPCSKFNFKEFETLFNENKDKLNFVVVLQTLENDFETAKNKFSQLDHHKIIVIHDEDGKIAESFGVYSSPQAVLTDSIGRIFYKGNYNVSRYCTQKKTSFARLAIESISKNKKLPKFGKEATTPYGCVLPSYK